MNLLPVPAASAALLRKIDAVDAKLSQDEQTLFQQALKEMDGLSTVVLNELKSQLQLQMESQRAAGFLQTEVRDLPKVANVAVGAAEPFATVASLVQEFESKQAALTGAAMTRILELEQKLLKEENALVQQALAAAFA